MATRHLCRSLLLQSLYEWDFYNNFYKSEKFGQVNLVKIIDRHMAESGEMIDEPDFIYRLAKNLADHLAEIDDLIKKAAPAWPLDQINIVDRNILRLGISELVFGDPQEVPFKVSINEAVELAKTFGGDSSARFVNGVMGTIYMQLAEARPEVRQQEKEFFEKKMKEREEAAKLLAEGEPPLVIPEGELLETKEDEIKEDDDEKNLEEKELNKKKIKNSDSKAEDDLFF